MLLMVSTGLEHGRLQALILRNSDKIMPGLSWTGPVTLKYESKLNPEPDAIGWSGSVPKIIFEVSDSTLKADLGSKKQLYQEEGIPHYVVIDIKGQKFHVFKLEGDSYVEDQEFKAKVVEVLKEAFEAWSI